MKINFTTALLAIACLSASALGYAQSPVRANPPLSSPSVRRYFQLANTQFRMSLTELSELHNWEKHVAMLVPATATEYVSQKPHQLVFRVYGDQYFLHEIRGGLGEFTLNIRLSKLEKETQRLAAARAKQPNAEIAMTLK